MVDGANVHVRPGGAAQRGQRVQRRAAARQRRQRRPVRQQVGHGLVQPVDRVGDQAEDDPPARHRDHGGQLERQVGRQPVRPQVRRHDNVEVAVPRHQGRAAGQEPLVAGVEGERQVRRQPRACGRQLEHHRLLDAGAHHLVGQRLQVHVLRVARAGMQQARAGGRIVEHQLRELDRGRPLAQEALGQVGHAPGGAAVDRTGVRLEGRQVRRSGCTRRRGQPVQVRLQACREVGRASGQPQAAHGLDVRGGAPAARLQREEDGRAAQQARLQPHAAGEAEHQRARQDQRHVVGVGGQHLHHACQLARHRLAVERIGAVRRLGRVRLDPDGLAREAPGQDAVKARHRLAPRLRTQALRAVGPHPGVPLAEDHDSPARAGAGGGRGLARGGQVVERRRARGDQPPGIQPERAVPPRVLGADQRHRVGAEGQVRREAVVVAEGERRVLQRQRGHAAGAAAQLAAHAQGVLRDLVGAGHEQPRARVGQEGLERAGIGRRLQAGAKKPLRATVLDDEDVDAMAARRQLDDQRQHQHVEVGVVHQDQHMAGHRRHGA